MDKLEFLDGSEESELESTAVTEEPTETPTTEPSEAPEAEQGRPRGPDGKFIGKAEGPKTEPVMVPIQALHETRDKVRDLEARLTQFEQPQQPQAAPQPPDMFADPEGYNAYVQQQIQQAGYKERLNFSHRLAVQQHGAEMVDQAVQWGQQRCAQDPHFNAITMSQPDPVGFAIEQYTREQIASQVNPTEFQQFQAWKAAQAQAQTQQQQPNTPPPASIASIPSSGGAVHVPVGPGQAFDTLFT